MKVNVVSLVYYNHSPKEYVLAHKHNYYELVFYKEGEGHVDIYKEQKKYEKNSVFIVKPGVLHDEFSYTDSIVYIVLFESDEPIKNTFTKISSEKAELIDDWFNIAFDEYKNQNSKYEDYVNSLFKLILLETLRSTKHSNKKKNDYLYIRHAKKYIQENYVKDIDFQMLAKSSGYSYGRFRHIFKEGTNTTLKQYLLNVRLDTAKKHLEMTDKSVHDIGVLCGFSNDSQFVAFFTKNMGISPLKFREMISQENEIGVVKINSKRESNGKDNIKH